MVSRLAALVCPVLLCVSTPAFASHGGGGGHGGGGHGGGHGGHGGHGHSSGHHGSYHHSGYHHVYHTGYNTGYGYGGYGYGLGYGNYGYGLGYGNYGYGNYGYNNYPSPYSNGYYYPQPLQTGVMPAGAFVPAPTAPPGTAQVSVVVPPGAQIWFNGQEDTTNSPIRTFNSAVLQPGQRSTVTVQMMRNGYSTQMTLPIVAGDRMSVDLSR